MEQTNNKKIYKNVDCKKFNTGLFFVWFFTVIIVGVLLFFLVKTVISPAYEERNGYSVLTTGSILLMVLLPISVVLVFFIASLISTSIKIKRLKYATAVLERIAAERAAREAKYKKEKKEAIFVPLEEDKSSDDDYLLERKKFLEQKEFKDLVSLFADYSVKNNVEFYGNTVTDIFAAIACSRVIFVEGMDANCVKEFGELLNGFFASEPYADVMNSEYEIYPQDENYSFYKWIMDCKQAEGLHFAVLDVNDMGRFEAYYQDFIPSMLLPNSAHYLDFISTDINEDGFVFPHSVWYIIPYVKGAVLPEVLVKNGVVLDMSVNETSIAKKSEGCDSQTIYTPTPIAVQEVSATENAESVENPEAKEDVKKDSGMTSYYNKSKSVDKSFIEELKRSANGGAEASKNENPVKDNKAGKTSKSVKVIETNDKTSYGYDYNDESPVTYARFEDIIKEECAVNTFTLDQWKKLDYLDAYIAKMQGQYFDNKTNRQIERYAAFEIGGGYTDLEALDKVLANRILPYLLTIPAENWKANEESISDFLDRVFGLHNLPLCERFITKTVLGSIQIKA